MCENPNFSIPSLPPFSSPQIYTVLSLFEILFAIPSRSNSKNITNNSHRLTILTRSSVLLDSAIFYSCGSLYRAHFRISFACRKQTYLYRNTWQVRNYFVAFNFMSYISDGLVNVLYSTCCTNSVWMQTVALEINWQIHIFGLSHWVISLEWRYDHSFLFP